MNPGNCFVPSTFRGRGAIFGPHQPRIVGGHFFAGQYVRPYESPLLPALGPEVSPGAWGDGKQFETPAVSLGPGPAAPDRPA